MSRTKYCLFHPYVACSEGKPSLNPCSKVNKMMKKTITKLQVIKMTTHDFNCKVMVNPHNESGGGRKNLQNGNVMVFRDSLTVFGHKWVEHSCVWCWLGP